jgi:hypothetical protein
MGDPPPSFGFVAIRIATRWAPVMAPSKNYGGRPAVELEPGELRAVAGTLDGRNRAVVSTAV